jgi:hypothetical protein
VFEVKHDLLPDLSETVRTTARSSKTQKNIEILAAEHSLLQCLMLHLALTVIVRHELRPTEMVVTASMEQHMTPSTSWHWEKCKENMRRLLL